MGDISVATSASASEESNLILTTTMHLGTTLYAIQHGIYHSLHPGDLRQFLRRVCEMPSCAFAIKTIVLDAEFDGKKNSGVLELAEEYSQEARDEVVVRYE